LRANPYPVRRVPARAVQAAEGVGPHRFGAGRGASAPEVALAMRSGVSVARKWTESLEPEAVHFLASKYSAGNIAGMDNFITQPQRFSREAVLDCLQRLVRGHESMMRTLWDVFNSLGERLDKHDEAMDRIRDRLWRIEHPMAGVDV